MKSKTLQTQDGIEYRDLNKNGRMDPYEDSRRPVEERIDDLLSQMTLEEKAGLMFHTFIPVTHDGSLLEGQGPFGLYSTSEMVASKLINHLNVVGITNPRLMAEWHNRLQQMAENTRLGIPVTISSDPRHNFNDNIVNMKSEGFSKWPDPLGLAAIGDPILVEEFGDIARQEYLAVGIRVALHPMADLATEPRWARINGTFGEDAELSARLTAAYIRGFQGRTVGPQSVACMTKHFPGGGPQKDGEDPHFPYGREQIYPGGNFDYHLLPFEAAFEAGTSQIMPYYGMPVGTSFEEVGFGFNKDIIDGLLRKKYKFDGIVCTDWGLLNNEEIAGKPFPARAWGVEYMSVLERARKALEAGVDQFGGEACPQVIVELVQSGKISGIRIDESIRRILRDKFRLGLFDNPFVNPDSAEMASDNPAFLAAGELAQRKSIVLLKNGMIGNGNALPARKGSKIYIENIAPEIAGAYGQVVDHIGSADLAILRIKAPYQPREGNLLEQLFHSGDLDFKEPELSRLLAILSKVPTIVDIYLDRPAVIPEIAEHAAGLTASFGASDAAVLDVIFGQFIPSGKLPFELPSSMDAVRQQKEDMPYDSSDPLFPFGHGLTYENFSA
jgi:beta-glucosidase